MARTAGTHDHCCIGQDLAHAVAATTRGANKCSESANVHLQRDDLHGQGDINELGLLRLTLGLPENELHYIDDPTCHAGLLVARRMPLHQPR